MKLFNKWGLNGKRILREENEQLKRGNKCLKNANRALSEQIKTMTTLLELLEKDKNDLKDKIHKEQGAKGGLVREINKLKKEKEELLKQIEDFKETHWLVKEIHPGRMPGKQKVRTGKTFVNNQVRKIQKEIAENRAKKKDEYDR